jgi:hypothetical protein
VVSPAPAPPVRSADLDAWKKRTPDPACRAALAALAHAAANRRA